MTVTAGKLKHITKIIVYTSGGISGRIEYRLARRSASISSCVAHSK
jgi:hypothetical protein